MPTYEYRCTGCDHRYELRQGFDAEPRHECPRCGAPAKRVIFPPPIVFKGKGFYVTDSRNGSNVTVGMDSAAADEAKKEDGAAAEKTGEPPSAPAPTSTPAASGDSSSTPAST